MFFICFLALQFKTLYISTSQRHKGKYHFISPRVSQNPEKKAPSHWDPAWRDLKMILDLLKSSGFQSFQKRLTDSSWLLRQIKNLRPDRWVSQKPLGSQKNTHRSHASSGVFNIAYLVSPVARQSGVFIHFLIPIPIFRVELSEPGLHDEPLPIKMCEVILQGGNVRLETSNSGESKMYWMCVQLLGV